MFSRIFLTVSLLIGQFVPSLAVGAFFTYLCQRRTTALWLMAMGTFLGFLLAPSIESVRENQIWFDDFLDNRIICAEYTGIGTLVGGLAIYLIERVQRLK
jgi:predicted membrane-bound spermidine synthase